MVFVGNHLLPTRRHDPEDCSTNVYRARFEALIAAMLKIEAFLRMILCVLFYCLCRGSFCRPPCHELGPRGQVVAKGRVAVGPYHSQL